MDWETALAVAWFLLSLAVLTWLVVEIFTGDD